MKIRRDIVDYVYFGFFGIIILLFITGQFGNVTGTTLVVIDNPDPNSMFPTYFQGDLFVIYKGNPQDIEIGDVIVYALTPESSRVIHRVIDVRQLNGEYYFRVKGDNPITNHSPDLANGGTLINFDQVLGRVVSRIPYLGHFSLAMQRNPSVQVIIALTVLGIALVVIFGPNDEEEEEYYEFTKLKYNQWKASWSVRMNNVRNNYMSSKYRLVIWTLTAVLLLILILPMFFPLFVPMPTGDDVGVYDIDLTYKGEMPERLTQNQDIFYNLSVFMYDDTSRFQYIEGYTLNVLSPNGDIIDTTIWYTRRIIKGQFMVGGSITIDRDIYFGFSTGTELTIEITVHYHRLFSTEDLDVFTRTFTTEASVVPSTI